MWGGVSSRLSISRNFQELFKRFGMEADVFDMEIDGVYLMYH